VKQEGQKEVIILDDDEPESGTRNKSTINVTESVSDLNRKEGAVESISLVVVEHNATNSNSNVNGLNNNDPAAETTNESPIEEMSELKKSLIGLAQQLDALDDSDANLDLLRDEINTEQSSPIEEGDATTDKNRSDSDNVYPKSSNNNSCNFPASSHTNNTNINSNSNSIPLDPLNAKINLQDKPAYGDVTPESEFCNVLLIVKDDMTMNQVLGFVWFFVWFFFCCKSRCLCLGHVLFEVWAREAHAEEILQIY
jgi:hypothetical protein